MAHIMQRVKVELSWANNFTNPPASLLSPWHNYSPLHAHQPTRAAAAAAAISARNSGAQLGKCVCQCVCQRVSMCVCLCVFRVQRSEHFQLRDLCALTCNLKARTTNGCR